MGRMSGQCRETTVNSSPAHLWEETLFPSVSPRHSNVTWAQCLTFQEGERKETSFL